MNGCEKIAKSCICCTYMSGESKLLALWTSPLAWIYFVYLHTLVLGGHGGGWSQNLVHVAGLPERGDGLRLRQEGHTSLTVEV